MNIYKKIAKALCFFISLSFLANCQLHHARVKMLRKNKPAASGPVVKAIPPSCKKNQRYKKNRKACKADKKKLEEELAQKAQIAASEASAEPVVKEFHHKYYVWGLYPKKVTEDISGVCPATRGIKEVYSYASLMDAALTQLTIGFYWPRTLKVSCY
ncbi:MAG: hypothetical protein AAF518_22200 [Spirochaetota bacterium]